MGIKAFNHGDDFRNKFVKAAASDSTGLDATPPPPQPEVSSSGGTSFVDGAGFKYHIFTSNGTFTTSADVSAHLMLAGGGGGGGIQPGGGGGGGAL